jgi:hypothetical protein
MIICLLQVRTYHGAYLSYAVSARASLFSFSINHDPNSPPVMSHTHTTSTPSNFQLILDNALKAYKKRTKKDLLKHPLADRLQACDSPSSILTVLQEQVQELNKSQRNNTKWLDPTVNVLQTFSETLGEGVGSVCFRT